MIRSPTSFYLNRGNGTFEEKAVASGVAFSEDGIARAGMGVDAADYAEAVIPVSSSATSPTQMLSLYHNEGNGLFCR